MVEGARIIAIELRRGGWGLAILALALASPLAIMRRYLWDAPGDTWFSLIDLGGAGVLFYACAGGVGAWIGSRATRLHMSEMLHGANRFGVGHHVVNLAVLWGCAGAVVGVVFGWVTLRLVPSAPFGPYPGMAVLTSLLAALAAASAGYAIGAAWGHATVPLAAAAAVYLPMIAARNVELLDALSPTTAPTLIYGSSVRVQPDRAFAWAYALWLGCLAFALVATIVWGRLRTPRAAIVAGVLVIACLAAATNAGLAGRRAAHAERAFLPATPLCQRVGQFELCVHPLDRAALPAAAATIAATLDPIHGLPGVPTVFYGFGLTPDEVPAGASPLLSLASVPGELGFRVALPVVSGVVPSFTRPATMSVPTASQIIVACTLAGVTTPETCHLQPSGTREGLVFLRESGPDTRQGIATLQQDMQAALARFARLEPAQRTAWLRAHWNALVEGSIALDALP